jgi:multiple sugar transport system substrate-binding protein
MNDGEAGPTQSGASRREENMSARSTTPGPTHRRRAVLLRGWATGVMTAATMAAAGCATLRGGAGQASVAISGPATARVLVFNNPIFTSVQSEMTAALGQVDPQVRVDYTLFPGQIDEFRTKMVALYAGGDIPDAQWVHPSITSLVGGKKLLKPLEEFARKDRSTPLSEFYPGLLDYFRWRDAQYALPFYATGYALVFNQALLSRIGVTAPDQLEKNGTWNWETFVTTLRNITRGTPGSADRTIGLQPITINLDWICMWIWQNGGDVFTKDAKKCIINEPPAVEALQWYADLYLKHQVVNFGGATTPDFPSGFFSGRVGLLYAAKGDTAAQVGSLSKADFALGMAPAPKGKTGRITRNGPTAFGVVQGGPNGDAGWRWVRFMSGPQAAAIFFQHQTTLPVRPKFAQLPEFAQSLLPWENKDLWLESQATSRALSQPTSYNDIATMWLATWADILAQKGPVKALLDDFASKANAAIAQES